MRLKAQDLKDVVDTINIFLMKDYVVGNWNGYYRVYTKSKGDLLITGTLRECYNYCIAYKHGVKDADARRVF